MSVLTRLLKEANRCSEVLEILDSSPTTPSIKKIYDSTQYTIKRSIEERLNAVNKSQEKYKEWTAKTRRNIENAIKGKSDGISSVKKVYNFITRGTERSSIMLEYLNVKKLSTELKLLSVTAGSLTHVDMNGRTESFSFVYGMLDLLMWIVTILEKQGNWKVLSGHVYAIYHVLKEMGQATSLKELELVFSSQWKDYLDAISTINDTCMICIAKIMIEDNIRYIEDFFGIAVKPVALQLIEVARKLSRRTNETELRLEHEHTMANVMLPDAYKLTLEWKSHFSETIKAKQEAKKVVISDQLYKDLEGVELTDDTEREDEIFDMQVSWKQDSYKISDLLKAIKVNLLDKIFMLYEKSHPKYKAKMESLEQSKQWVDTNYPKLMAVMENINETILAGGVLGKMLLEVLQLHFQDTVEMTVNLWIQSRTSNRCDVFEGSKFTDNNTITTKILKEYGYDDKFIVYMTNKTLEYEKFVKEHDSYVSKSVKAFQEAKGFGKITGAFRLFKGMITPTHERKPNDDYALNSHFVYGEAVVKCYDAWFGANGAYVKESSDTIEKMKSTIEEVRNRNKQNTGIMEMLKFTKPTRHLI